MSREEAISHIFGLSSQVDSEFCCSASESDALYKETEDALRALGVTPEELRAE